MSASKSKKLDEAAQEAMQSELSSSAFFQTTSIQNDKTTSSQVVKTTKPQVEKYTTHLRPETIKAIKVYAAAHDLKDYEVAQMIFDRFFQEQENYQKQPGR